jgi:hypothetical protein
MAHAPTVSASITAAAAEAGIEPPTPEQIAGIQGATVVLPPDSAASAGARGVYDDPQMNTALRDAGYVQLGVDPADPGAEPTPPPPEGGNGGTASAPVNRDVPFVDQAGSELRCTMGNWTGEPTAYVYQWKMDGTDIPGDGATLPVTAADTGHSATCVVTAENAHGSTTAPPSNAVVVA